ncbi:MAG TPA: SRPBCC domain-containing protein [Prolixibacteraceae bacterium]|nr:SRPBCC domain-containing protein [Prolixibacteraceae bacterium]
MADESFVIERTFEVTGDRIWKAITDKDEMKQWYFDFQEFIPEVGFEFQFWGGPDENRRYLHLCKITEVIHEKRLTYSWRYDGYEGNTLVTFELFARENQTTLKLTHEGLKSFSSNNPDFAKENFIEGWTWLIGTSLKDFLKENNHQ